MDIDHEPLKQPANEAEGLSAQEQDLAVALYYDGQNAPRVTAKGESDLAREIMAIAEAFAVPMFRQSELAQTLYQLELNDEVPEPLYVAVAEIIAFAYQLEGRFPGDGKRPQRRAQVSD